MALGKSYTTRVRCPKCKSDDCNYTTETVGKAIVADIRTFTTYCNTCTYSKVVVSIGMTEVFTETQEPGSDETELEYKYLGKERF